MPMVRSSLLAATLAGPALAQQVQDCDEIPPVTSLVEPWEETSLSIGAGAIRLALLHGTQDEGVTLLVLTLPPPEPGGEDDGAAATSEGPPPPPPVPRCRLVTEGGLGFAGLDIGAIETDEDAEAATLTAAIPALGFIPESTQLEERTLTLTFGVTDDSLVADLD
ncbi:hypothetical protein [Rubellimicrobium arenae]|uniref:hypothetical protein n=1 Tax=Rubellimicrobium arenae TaxID=2817372 RepID=UPI001B30B699|nr:hypothetical protein [Rubellimicrobium arenae]